MDTFYKYDHSLTNLEVIWPNLVEWLAKLNKEKGLLNVEFFFKTLPDGSLQRYLPFRQQTCPVFFLHSTGLLCNHCCQLSDKTDVHKTNLTK